MAKPLDTRQAEYAYVDRIVIFNSVNTSKQTIYGEINPETNEQESSLVDVTNSNIYMNIKYDIKDQDKNSLTSQEKNHILYQGPGTKSIQDIAELINFNLSNFVVQDKLDITGVDLSQPTP